MYMIGLAIQALHGLVLTVGAVVIFADPARVGLTSFIPLGALLFYVTHERLPGHRHHCRARTYDPTA